MGFTIIQIDKKTWSGAVMGKKERFTSWRNAWNWCWEEMSLQYKGR